MYIYKKDFGQTSLEGRSPTEVKVSVNTHLCVHVRMFRHTHYQFLCFIALSSVLIMGPSLLAMIVFLRILLQQEHCGSQQIGAWWPCEVCRYLLVAQIRSSSCKFCLLGWMDLNMLAISKPVDYVSQHFGALLWISWNLMYHQYNKI